MQRRGGAPYTIILLYSFHRKILGVTRSNWGTRNDKIIVRIDTYITDVHKGKVRSDIDYNVIIDGEFRAMRGVYYLCDGDYDKWNCMMNPMKHTSGYIASNASED